MALNTEAAHTQAHSADHVHGGPKLYGMILGALLFLTVITVGASYIDWGGGLANIIIAMLIASMKASLVALFFMHLRWDKPLSAIIFCVSLFFLGLFLVGCYTDTISRAPTEPTNMKSADIPGGQIGPRQNQAAPTGTVGPGGTSTAPPIPGASPQGAHGGAAAGTNKQVPQVPTQH
ncbi:MAG TPA: cytochrome C oxidase subunit IV family protein [Bryobacteraceae bacterium]|nr:cytochrome C oxidase subunit IV family protein [Bryobacteraceae bacterium]